GPEASGAISKKRKKPKSKKTPNEDQVTPPTGPTKGFKQSHSVSSGNVPDPQDPERNKQLAGTRLPSTPLDEGTRKSQPFPEGTTIDPKGSGRNVYPADKGLPSILLMKADQTQSARLRYWSLTKNKGKTSSEVEMDSKALQLITFANVQALLLFDDEIVPESDED
ncbi:hypothetical protein Tco_1348043, partial [Tanacetum coccineum]